MPKDEISKQLETLQEYTDAQEKQKSSDTSVSGSISNENAGGHLNKDKAKEPSGKVRHGKSLLTESTRNAREKKKGIGCFASVVIMIVLALLFVVLVLKKDGHNFKSVPNTDKYADDIEAFASGAGNKISIKSLEDEDRVNMIIALTAQKAELERELQGYRENEERYEKALPEDAGAENMNFDSLEDKEEFFALLNESLEKYKGKYTSSEAEAVKFFSDYSNRELRNQNISSALQELLKE